MNWTDADRAFMAQAIELATGRMGETWPNPAVGCVLVKDGVVLAEAATAPGGEFDFTADPRYAGKAIPDTESLKTTLERVKPYWDAEIAPRLKAGEDVLIAAHGNSLRAIVKLLFAVPDDKIVGVEIPTGNPLEIELDAELKPTAARYLDAARAETLPTAS